MSRRIVVEALVVVVTLRFDELRGKVGGRLRRGGTHRIEATGASPTDKVHDVTAGPAAADGPSVGKGG
jgi:hypothetical protein